ncbi:DUF1134 domain-containing protein [Sphingomonas paeninsulae]|uniref:DUF1134 domain-containing protein n=1 Tax=Sphingomonas paeninsulae TaxID=2319844 RepID=A0A494TMS8_SPHPE|nr:EipA family protein [Sphingomonas paeninsulae]AYJ86395.1 DUF1134 domain-containing protein [Sphingomonas paeninsulae]
MLRKPVFSLIAAAFALVATPVLAQVRTVDPNAAAQADVSQPVPGERGYATQAPPPQAQYDKPQNDRPQYDRPQYETPPPADTTTVPVETTGAAGTAPASSLATQATPTYHKDDLIGAAEGVFGKGAAGLAGLLEKILKDQGEPNAYIAGREASGAFVVGLRYGSGTLSHKVEGQRPAYWTGPSVGFDVGGDATKVFTLVYNLYDSQDLFRRYPQVEGRAYFVGGFSATYLRRGNIVLIPVRLGVGMRLGANIGYMKFTEKSRWLPF